MFEKLPKTEGGPAETVNLLINSRIENEQTKKKKTPKKTPERSGQSKQKRASDEK